MTEDKEMEEKKQRRKSDLSQRKQISELLNKILDSNIKWYKLSLEDLDKVAGFFTDPDELYKKLKSMQSGFKEIKAEDGEIRELIRQVAIKTGIKIVEKHDGPISNYIKELLKGMEK